MAARCPPCSFPSLLLLLLAVLLPVLPPVSQEELPRNGGNTSPSDGETPVLEDVIPRGEEEPSDVTSKGDSPFVKSSSSAMEGRTLSVGDELPAQEEQSSVDDDPSSRKGEPGGTADDPELDTLLQFRSAESPRKNSSREETGDKVQEDDIISRTSVMKAVQMVTPAVWSLRQEPPLGGSAAAGPRRLIEGRETLIQCKQLYRSVYKINPPKYGNAYLFISHSLVMFLMKKFVDLCRPLFLAYENCENYKFLTLCRAARVGFLHSHECRKPSHQEKHFNTLLAFYLLENNIECFEGVCDGSFRLVESRLGGLTYRIFNIVDNPYNKRSCGNGFVKTGSLRDSSKKTMYVVKNTVWPCCYPTYIVTWLGHPEEQGLNGGWSYLPASCRAGEVLLMVIVAAVAVIGVVGNLLVVVVMLSSVHRGQESSMLRTSLAFADLLNGLFVVIPSFCYHLAPFFGPPEYETLTKHQTFVVSHIVKRNAPDFVLSTQFIYKSGFRLFQSLIYGTCSFVSLLTLCLLSTERLVMTGRAMRYNHYVTKQRIKTTIVFTWVLGLLETILFYYDTDGNISTEWSTFTKLPYRTTKTTGSLTYAFFTNLHVAIFILAGITTVAFSLIALRNFVHRESVVATEWKSYGMKATVLYFQENRRILTTMALIIVLYLISVVPTAILMIMNFANYWFDGIFLFGYLAEWLFLASTAWNPWLYNMRSSQFTGDLVHLLYKLLPTPVRERLGPSMTRSHHKEKWENIELTPARKMMLSKLGLTET